MVTEGKICDFIQGLKPALLMVVVQVVFAGVNVFYKVAANDGMSLRIIVAYRFIFATALMVPLALIFERKSRPRLTWTVLLQAFFCGLFGLEKLGLRTASGKAKVLGTLMGIGGAMLLTFYKGFPIHFLSTNIDLLTTGRHVASPHPSSGGGGHVMGALLALGSCFSYALWLIIQAKMSEKYPCHYTSTALMCFMGSIQAIVFALCIERDWSQWNLGWNIRLWTVAYSGVVASGLMVTLVSWCVRMRGPLFVSVFNPLMLVLVAIAGALFLDEKLYLGSILGAILIVFGLYAVLWGKDKEMKKMTQLVPSKSSEDVEDIEIAVTSPTSREASK